VNSGVREGAGGSGGPGDMKWLEHSIPYLKVLANLL